MTESNAKPAPPAADERPKLEDFVAPIFDRAMGQRMALMRMHRLWDQRELAGLLGLSAMTVSKLESGRLAVPREPFTAGRLESIFGSKAFKYIMFGQYSAVFESLNIEGKFRQLKFVTEAKPRKPSQHWTHKRLEQGQPVRGAMFMGIPGDVWDAAWAMHKGAKNKKTTLIKRKEKKSGG